MGNDLIERIDGIIQNKGLLGHPFYQAWTKGTLPLESMKEYASQYFHFEAAYPTFLSGLHFRCEDQDIRQLILDNLWDEEHGADNHVELWLRFCDALDLDREAVRTGEPVSATAELVAIYKDLTSNAPSAAGAAALYAYESQVPEVAKAKIKGLSENYGINDRDSVSFFEVHRTLDLEHSDAERDMLIKLASTDDEADAAVKATEEATGRLWDFLDGVYKS